jgi:WD40 repeat protein
MLASGNDDRTILLWDVNDPARPKLLGAPLTGHTDFVWGVAFSPDGKTLASGSGDDTIILWDVSDPARAKTLGAPLTGHSDAVWGVAFSPDGKTLASGSGDDTIILWDVNVEAWKERACRIANRNLTQAEWQQYMGESPYHKTCEGIP